MANRSTSDTTWTAEQVWAAAALAQRINSGYYKDDEKNADGKTTVMKNINLVRAALDDVEQIPQEDFEVGRAALAHISQRLVVKALKGRLKDFDELMTRIVHIDKFTSSNRYEIAVVASQIRSYEDSKKELEWQEQIDRNAGHLAPIGEKVEVDVNLTKVIWSTNYGIYFYQGITPTKQGVWFTNKNRLKEGSNVQIKGTVTKHRDFSTQLNRVRILQGETA